MPAGRSPGESSASIGSSRLAAFSSRDGASLPRFVTNARSAAIRSIRACCKSVLAPASAMDSNCRTASKAPAWKFARRGTQRPLGATRGVQRQHRGALEECRRRSHAATRLRPVRAALQLRGHILVGPSRGMGPMPGASIGIQLRIGDLSQSPMHLLPLLRQRRPVDHRAHEGMPKPHPSAELGQARLDRGRRRFGADPEPRGGSPHQYRIADRLGRRDQQQPPGLFREDVAPAGGSSRRYRPTAEPRREAQIPRPAAAVVNPRGNSSNASGLP